MRVLLTAALLFAAPAFAEEPPIEALNDAMYACTSGENHDGDKIDEKTSKAGCVEAIGLLLKISEQGYCHSPDGGWIRCKPE